MALQDVNGGRERHSRVQLIFGGEKKLNLVDEKLRRESERFEGVASKSSIGRARNQRYCSCSICGNPNIKIFIWIVYNRITAGGRKGD